VVWANNYLVRERVLYARQTLLTGSVGLSGMQGKVCFEAHGRRLFRREAERR